MQTRFSVSILVICLAFDGALYPAVSQSSNVTAEKLRKCLDGFAANVSLYYEVQNNFKKLTSDGRRAIYLRENLCPRFKKIEFAYGEDCRLFRSVIVEKGDKEQKELMRYFNSSEEALKLSCKI